MRSYKVYYKKAKAKPRTFLPPGYRNWTNQKKEAYNTLKKNGIDPAEIREENWIKLADELSGKEFTEDTPLEQILIDQLESNNISYKRHYHLPDVKYPVEFFIEPNIVISIEGYRKHTEYAQWERDHYIYNELAILGYQCLKYSGKYIKTNPRKPIMDIERIFHSNMISWNNHEDEDNNISS